MNFELRIMNYEWHVVYEMEKQKKAPRFEEL